MRVRLGYVSISKTLENSINYHNITYTEFNKNKDYEKLDRIILSNFETLENIIEYNKKNNIHFYRLTSKLIPLSTHPEVLWQYDRYFSKELKRIGEIVKKSNMRIDFHPDQFNVVNSIKENVVKDTLRNLNHAVDLYDLMDYDDGKLVIHVGSSAGGKGDSINRFIDNFNEFPKRIRKRLILENDDKIFTAKDVLFICEKIKIPMVLDVHHHNCKNDGENLSDLMKNIFDTWSCENLPPKIHFSSPKEGKLDRKHADYIDVNEFASFLNLAKESVNNDFDVMIEAKKKDLALFKLIDDLRKINYPCEFIDESTIKI